MEEKTPLLHHTKLCAFRCLILGPQNLILRSRNQICGKILLSQKQSRYLKTQVLQVTASVQRNKKQVQ